MVKRDEQNNGRKREHMGQNENPSYVSVFGDREIIVDEKIIDGTHLFAIFGDITLDASHATCEEDTIIEVTSIFSDVDLFIPDNIRVVLKGNPILGDIKDRRRVTSRLHDGPLLTVRVLCLFGDVIIR
jgi:predicted membrane protein